MSVDFCMFWKLNPKIINLEVQLSLTNLLTATGEGFNVYLVYLLLTPLKIEILANTNCINER